MTPQTDIDDDNQKQHRLFESDQVDLSRIRVRPAEFSRLMGCSKQSVSIWIRDGKITLGTDGRLDPSRAVAQLLKNSNPSQLRANALKPIIAQVKDSEKLIQDLKKSLEETTSDSEFYEAATNDLLELLDSIEEYLDSNIDDLAKIPTSCFIKAFLGWLSEARKTGPADLSIFDFVAARAPEEVEKGAGQ